MVSLHHLVRSYGGVRDVDDLPLLFHPLIATRSEKDCSYVDSVEWKYGDRKKRPSHGEDPVLRFH